MFEFKKMDPLPMDTAHPETYIMGDLRRTIASNGGPGGPVGGGPRVCILARLRMG